MISRSIITKYAPYMVWAFFIYFCFYYAVEITEGGNSWKTGDWLINYSSGPIRRGLLGTILLNISDMGLPLLWLTYAVQVAIYAIIFIFVLKIYKHKERSFFWLLILFSPSFLLFPFYDLPGGFRKEIIVFAIFSYFCLIYVRKSITYSKLLLISVAYGFASLSHEITIFTLPFFLYLLHVSVKENIVTSKIAITYSVILTFVSLASLLFSFLYKGDVVSEKAICSSLINRNYDMSICKGAIAWLSKDTHDVQNIVVNNLSYKSIYVPILFFITMLPLLFCTTWWRKERIILLAVSIVTILPLFFVAIDWGRWIYILSFMFFCLSLAEKLVVKFSYKHIFFIAGLIYLTTWSVPHCCVGMPSELGVGNGFLEKVSRTLLKHL